MVNVIAYILQKFKEVTKEPYSYLVVDLKPETPEWRRLCSNVFEEEASDDMQTDRTIPVEDTDPDQMGTLDDILIRWVPRGESETPPSDFATVARVRIDDEHAGLAPTWAGNSSAQHTVVG
jgi:hypothetical protein